MRSSVRLAIQISVVLAATASAWLVLGRLSPPLPNAAGTEVRNADKNASPEAEPAPTTVQSQPVAARAQARVQRLLPATIKPFSLKTPEPVVAAARESVSRLRKIRACERKSSTDCPLQTAVTLGSAVGYSDQLVDQTIAELAFLKALAKSESDDRRAPTFSIHEVAGAYIRHRDDNVREQALGLASLMVSSQPAAVVDIASRALKSTVSGPLAIQALGLLEASREANPQLVDKTLLQALKTGGWDVRDAVADRLLPFLTPANRDTFSRIMAAAPVRSKLRLHMRLNIEEFDRMDRL